MGNEEKTTGAEALFASLTQGQLETLNEVLLNLSVAAVKHVMVDRAGRDEMDRCKKEGRHSDCKCDALYNEALTVREEHHAASVALTDALIAMVPQ